MAQAESRPDEPVLRYGGSSRRWSRSRGGGPPGRIPGLVEAYAARLARHWTEDPASVFPTGRMEGHLRAPA